MTNTELATITYPAYLAFVIDAYQTYYDPLGSLATYFAASALPCVETYFSNGWYGANDTDNFNNCVGNTLTDSTLNSTFITAYNGGDPSVADIKQAILANDIYNWKPLVPTRFYYSPYDEAVPPANTITAYSTMLANGSTSVETATCALTTAVSFHSQCSIPYFGDVVSYFSSYVTDL